MTEDDNQCACCRDAAADMGFTDGQRVIWYCLPCAKLAAAASDSPKLKAAVEFEEMKRRGPLRDERRGRSS